MLQDCSYHVKEGGKIKEGEKRRREKNKKHNNSITNLLSRI